ncbi:hypothetical protein G4B88_008397 [Cannabis sativa]|uniref:RNase H type-1 domain-containing protein n=1 Tax=Cannabis sativa TaxID=3483 RepID=A0A7J6F5D7_CANSA|nr:hypothetical protein G4B88_008397 [Cannabis sativa]
MGQVEEFRCTGSFFTWTNKHEVGNLIFSKLDRLSMEIRKISQSRILNVIKVLWALWEKQNRHRSNMPYMNGTKLLSGCSVRWLALPEGVICTHGNAALKPGKVGVGIGFVWRDWCGNLISGGMTFLPSYCTVAVAEAWAILEALKALPNNETRSFEIR